MYSVEVIDEYPNDEVEGQEIDAPPHYDEVEGQEMDTPPPNYQTMGAALESVEQPSTKWKTCHFILYLFVITIVMLGAIALFIFGVVIQDARCHPGDHDGIKTYCYGADMNTINIVHHRFNVYSGQIQSIAYDPENKQNVSVRLYWPPCKEEFIRSTSKSDVTNWFKYVNASMKYPCNIEKHPQRGGIDTFTGNTIDYANGPLVKFPVAAIIMFFIIFILGSFFSGMYYKSYFENNQ